LSAVTIIIRAAQGWLHFHDLRALYVATTPAQVRPLLQRIEHALDAGACAAGFLAYEAASAFDSACVTHAPDGFPLLWFGVFQRAQLGPPPPLAPPTVTAWHMSMNAQQYRTVIDRIKSEIRAGNVYQINYTLPLVAEGVTAGARICVDARYGAWLESDDFALDCGSPELFFQVRNGNILTRPMKGTAARGINAATDAAQRAQLAASAKDRAENLMIVDMLRNDLGRIAEPGSIQVPHLFSLEKYPTVWQMTSTVRARTRASISAIMAALFPCASITGAPKIQAMRLIHTLETQARRVYTGTIGYLLPNGEARFNVAIRTILYDKRRQHASYGVGSGIVWDSQAAQEYEECRIKARILSAPTADSFALLETLRWRGGYVFCAEHLKRLAQAAAYFDYAFDASRAQAALDATASKFESTTIYKVRLLMARNGRCDCDSAPLPPSHARLRVGLAQMTQTADAFVCHKTTRRDHYETIKARFPDCDDVILYNADGLVTESCFANVVIYQNGAWLTPDLAAALLDGVFRHHLLAGGRIRAAPITVAQLRSCNAIYLINSVRLWRFVGAGSALVD
jgi:para-aminobenzoate synthetase / 4-amino-4-deoxychorismate lyase